MTRKTEDIAPGESLTPAYYDIALLFESAEDADARVIRVLERLRSLVPYEQCALLEALPGGELRLVTHPDTPPAERAELTATTTALLERLVERRAQTVERRAQTVEGSPIRGAHLAVPLVGLDEVIGVLFVRAADGDYDERDVRRLSVVAAKLAAYLCMLRASALAEERARQLEEARRAAEAANRAKDEFLALISHELRTPLNTILAWIDALRSKDASEADRARALEAIERSVRMEAKLVEDLLDVSCVAKAAIRLDLRAVEPASLIEAALRTLRPRAEKKSILLEAVLDGSVTPLIGDPHRLSQIVTNLVTNAIKFTPEGGRVEVRLERAGTLARIRVLDTGSGISPEALPRIFERFSQADSSTTRAHGGLGVGLSLVKDLVELHGGRVHAESPGDRKGATFTVDLPLAGGPPIAPVERRDGEPHDGRALAGIRVLLVDDDEDICEVLQFVLEGQGAVVTVALSAAEALAAIERSTPHVLISDLAMPGGTGYELIRKVLAREGDNAPPAAALSAYGPGYDRDDALASGFRKVLAKPVDPGVLIATVADLARSAGRDGFAGRQGEGETRT